MKKTKTINVTKNEEQVVDILCNMCGQTCNNSKRKKVKGMISEYSGLIEAEVHGGYDSEVVGDLRAWRFSICEPCLHDKVVSQFKIPCDVKDNDISADFLRPEVMKKKYQERKKANKEELITQLLKDPKHKKSSLVKLTNKELSALFWADKNSEPTG